MRKNRLWIFLLLLLAGGGGSLCAQSMSDSQVLEYVKESVRQGKEQKQIAAELARRGVTKEQALRVKEQYERQNGTAASTMTGTDQNEARLREETKDGTSAMLDEQPTTQELAQEEQVFGRNIFNTRNLTFEPNSNLPTPPNYRLGPGDEVVIDIWGASQNTIRQTISPDGTINLQELGPAYLSGMTVEEAGRFLKAELGKVYSNENNQIRVTLGNTRTIQINIMGEVVQPGTYALSAFSTVFHALYRAGGVNRIGSLRDVQLVRNGKRIASVDVYDFILEGRVKSDISLQEGDVVIVPAYESLVKMSGKVKRAMKFEMRKDETLATLLDYAGGFEADAYTKTVRIVRQNGEEYEVRTVEEKDYPVTELRDGDVVTVGAILNRFTNKVEIKKAVDEGNSPAVFYAAEQNRYHITSQLVRPFIYVAGDTVSARKAYESLTEYAAGPVALIPDREDFLIPRKTAFTPTLFERIKGLVGLAKGDYVGAVVTAEGYAQFFPNPKVFLDHTVTIKKGEVFDPEKLASVLAETGYKRVTLCESSAEFSVRGDVTDVFPVGEVSPVRITFFGDEIESIKFYDPASMQYKGETDEITVMPATDILKEHQEPFFRSYDENRRGNGKVYCQPVVALERTVYTVFGDDEFYVKRLFTRKRCDRLRRDKTSRGQNSSYPQQAHSESERTERLGILFRRAQKRDCRFRETFFRRSRQAGVRANDEYGHAFRSQIAFQRQGKRFAGLLQRYGIVFCRTENLNLQQGVGLRGM